MLLGRAEGQDGLLDRAESFKVGLLLLLSFFVFLFALLIVFRLVGNLVARVAFCRHSLQTVRFNSVLIFYQKVCELK